MYIFLTVLQRMFIHTIRFGNIYSNQRLNHRRSIARISTCFLSLQDDTPWFWRNAIVDCLKRCVTPDLLTNLGTFVTIDLLFLEIYNKLDNEYLNVDETQEKTILSRASSRHGYHGYRYSDFSPKFVAILLSDISRLTGKIN